MPLYNGTVGGASVKDGLPVNVVREYKAKSILDAGETVTINEGEVSSNIKRYHSSDTINYLESKTRYKQCGVTRLNDDCFMFYVGNYIKGYGRYYNINYKTATTYDTGYFEVLHINMNDSKTAYLGENKLITISSGTSSGSGTSGYIMGTSYEEGYSSSSDVFDTQLGYIQFGGPLGVVSVDNKRKCVVLYLSSSKIYLQTILLNEENKFEKLDSFLVNTLSNVTTDKIVGDLCYVYDKESSDGTNFHVFTVSVLDIVNKYVYLYYIRLNEETNEFTICDTVELDISLYDIYEDTKIITNIIKTTGVTSTTFISLNGYSLLIKQPLIGNVHDFYFRDEATIETTDKEIVYVLKPNDKYNETFYLTCDGILSNSYNGNGTLTFNFTSSYVPISGAEAVYIKDNVFALAFNYMYNSKRFCELFAFEFDDTNLHEYYFKTDHDGIALEDAAYNGTVLVGIEGYCKCPGVTKGDVITSDGVVAYAVEDDWLDIIPAYDRPAVWPPE